jgi:type IV secretory pathway TraG/TraD family ATPase VirD4
VRTTTDLIDPDTLDFTVTPHQALYAGINPATRQALWTTKEDSAGVLGPQRYGKTGGVLTPNLLHWSGPAIVASTRGDILRATGDRRAALAEAFGGRVHVYDPFGSEPDVWSMRWTPLSGCEDPALVYRRVAEMTATAGQGMSDGEHWRAGAARILRGVFHAAALDGRTLGEVATWLGNHDVSEAINILRARQTPAKRWAGSLQGLDRLGDRERGSFFSVALRTLEVVEEPTVEASTMGNELDIDRFLDSRSTLYIVSPSHYQDALAPMIVGLITAITQRASELAQARGGRLDPALLLALDEVANIAPIGNLSGLASEGSGRGIVLMWAAQTLDRMRERYGEAEAMAIWGAATLKLVFGGLANHQDLAMLSAWEGERREQQLTTYAGGAEQVDRLRPTMAGVAEPQDSQRQHSLSWIYRPVLPPEQIRQTAPFAAHAWYRSDPAQLVAVPHAARIRPYVALSGYTTSGGPL